VCAARGGNNYHSDDYGLWANDRKRDEDSV